MPLAVGALVRAGGLRAFLDALHGDTGGKLEVRLIQDVRGGSCLTRAYESVDALIGDVGNLGTIARAEGRAIHLGVLPRASGAWHGSNGSAAKVDVIDGWAAWCDIDFKDVAEAEARKRIANLPCPPSIVVTSGRGLHLYWLMRETTAPGELADVSERLAYALGGDHCYDVARILRLPGSLNLKACWSTTGAYTFNAAAARASAIESMDTDRRYIVDDFSMFPEPPVKVDAAAIDWSGVALPDTLPATVATLIESDERIRGLWDGTGSRLPNADLSNSGWAFALVRELARRGLGDADLRAAFMLRPRTDGKPGDQRQAERAVAAVRGWLMAEEAKRAARAASTADRWEDVPPPGDDDARYGDEDDPPIEQAPVAGPVGPDVFGRDQPSTGKSEPAALPWVAADLAWVTEELPPREWLIHDHASGTAADSGSLALGRGMLPRGKVGMLMAGGGTGKTYALVALALSIATGKPWLGWYPMGASRRGRVALILGEEDRDEVRRRIFTQARGMGLDLEERARVSGVITLGGAGLDLCLLRTDPKTHAVVRSERARELEKHLVATAGDGWDAILIDPLSRFAGAESEVDNSAATRFVEELERFAKLPGAPAVLVAHHTSQGARSSGDDSAVAARGVTGLTDGVRWAMAMTPVDTTGLGLGFGVVELVNNKSNYSPAASVLPEWQQGVKLVPTGTKKARPPRGLLLCRRDGALSVLGRDDTKNLRVAIERVKDNGKDAEARAESSGGSTPRRPGPLD